MRVTSLASGSSGNVLLIEAGPNQRTKLLIDAGINARLIVDRLRTLKVLPSQLQGVLVTHEHSDHVQAIPMLLKRYDLPIITNTRTYQAIEKSIATGYWQTDNGVAVALSNTLASEDGNVHELADVEQVQETALELMEEREKHFLPLKMGVTRRIGDIEVVAFPVPHDAVAPSGYLLKAGGCRVCLITDCGEVTPEMLTYMQHADLLILEANHDRQKLIRGPYPYNLKQRILSPSGHLSNDQAAEAVLQTWRPDGLRWLWLVHLSRTNNTPSLALQSVRANLQAARANLAQIHISVSPPGMGPVWDSTQLWQAAHMWKMSR